MSRKLKNISKEFFDHMSLVAIWGYIKRLQFELKELQEIVRNQHDRITELDRLTIELADQMDPVGE